MFWTDLVNHSVQILIIPFRFIFLLRSPVKVSSRKWNVRPARAQLTMFWSARKLVGKATKRFVVGRKRKSTWVTMGIGIRSKLRTTWWFIFPEKERTIYTVHILFFPKNGKFSASFSLFTTSSPTGCTVTSPMVTMTRSWEDGLAVSERFEELNIECDDWVRFLDWEGWGWHYDWRIHHLSTLTVKISSLCSGTQLSSFVLVVQISS